MGCVGKSQITLAGKYPLPKASSTRKRTLKATLFPTKDGYVSLSPEKKTVFLGIFFCLYPEEAFAGG